MAIEPTPTPAGRRWTEAQLLGIRTVKRSLLVSAAAGSGKTAVLSERCAYLVCDATPPCDVDQLLVVTFTEAAAAEMKSRIERALQDRLSSGESPHLSRQLALVEHAQVSTIHAFCARLLRQHFHLVGLDPNFTILDGDEAKLLRNEVARELFQDCYESDESGNFQKLVDAYADGNDERLVEQVIRIHELASSLVDPQAWRRQAIARIAEAAQGPLENCVLGRELIELIGSNLTALRDRCAVAMRVVKPMQGFGKYLQQLEEFSQMLAHWDSVFRSHGLDALVGEVTGVEVPKLPSIPNTTPGKDIAAAAIESVRKELKEGRFRQALLYSTPQWQDGLGKILPHARLLLELVDDFSRRYSLAKRATRSLDFSDLERYALRVLRDDTSPNELVPSPVARMLHRQFHHVLVDEYQDINELQDAILHLVSRECLVRKDEGGRMKDEGDGAPSLSLCPNLFCVGDVKQSIYRFRLAEPARFLDRHRRFSDAGNAGVGQVIDLRENFRSRGPLLEALNEVFKRLMTRTAAEIEYDRSHWLQPGVTYPDADGNAGFTGSPIELHLLPDRVESSADVDCETEEGVDFERAEVEAMLVARRVHELMGSTGKTRKVVAEKDGGGGIALRPIRFGDIVILLRSLRHKADQYADILRQSGIPVHSESGTGFFASTEIRDMLAMLSLLDNQRQDIPLAAILRSPLAAMPNPEDCLARIRLAYAKMPEPIPFHRSVVRYAEEQDDELAARLRDFLADLKKWREMAHQRPLAETIWTIYDQTGYMAFCAGLQDGQQRCANLIYLHERARQFGTFHRQGLARFMQFLEGLQSESDLGQPSVASQADDVVRIMSVHRSKGLEFPVVILPDLGKTINLQDCAGSILVDRAAFLGMSVVEEAKRIRYPSLASMLVQERLRRQSLAEELRVLYVAMTRAKEHLILIGTCGEKKPDEWASLWAGHRGPLPAPDVLAARNMLQWIGPVAAALEGEGKEMIRLTRHSPEDVAQWGDPRQQRPRPTQRQIDLADLKPLVPAPTEDPVAQDIIRRLRFAYPHEPFTHLPAAAAATKWSKENRIELALESETSPDEGFERALSRPRTLSTDLRPLATDIGEAAHRVLEHLDFRQSCDTKNVSHQIEQMVARKLVNASQAKLVDQASIGWLMESEVGKLLRAHAANLRRELPFYYAAATGSHPQIPASDDPLDQVMIRGRIDVLIPTEGGLIVIDYKTDRVSPQAMSQRQAIYQPQMALYRDAVEKIARQPVVGIHLAFLTPRMIWSM